ncbi:MAG: sulfite exporter TauE/SafE family protein [Vicinamibacterales bacterium]
MLTEVTLTLGVLTAVAGAVAGGLGAMLGIGGGVFLVPALVQGLGVPMPQAVAVSLTTVIATSNMVSAEGNPEAINMRLGLVIELATVVGGLTGSLISAYVPARHLMLLFSGVLITMAVLTFARRDHRNNLPASADVGGWGGRFVDARTGQLVAYRVRRLPLAVGVSFVAGNLATMLGIGGGVVKVPVLNGWCGLPMRVAAATSAFMIGLTATSGALIYFGRGVMLPALAASAVVGVRLGSPIGLRVGQRQPPRRLKMALAIVLLVAAGLMLRRLP